MGNPGKYITEIGQQKKEGAPASQYKVYDNQK
jgi:hypothetical protein